VIGLAVALELRRRALDVVIVERGAPGREASHAAAGMLAWCESHPVPAQQALAQASFRAYPEFTHELEDESGQPVDLRLEGTLQVLQDGEAPPPIGCVRHVPADELGALEPGLAAASAAALLEEGTVDPRALCVALERAAKHRGIEMVTGMAATRLMLEGSKVAGVYTTRTEFPSPVVVNCCGAWAGEMVGGRHVPTRPVKGQMLAVVGGTVVRHVIRGREVYVVPRTDGRVLIGATVEEAGFDKRVAPETIQRLHQAAANLIPQLGEAKMLEAWAGLRPATPDGLPILGPTSTPGYFVASGHFRDGILLAPITAKIMADLITGAPGSFDLAPFAPERFA